MFPVDSVSAVYMEARLQDQRLRQQEQEAAQQKAAAQKAAAPAPATATHSLQQPRPTFLSGMFAGLVRTSTFNSPITSRSVTPAATPLPSPSKVPTQAEIEAALIAERKRDADICAMPAWYH